MPKLTETYVRKVPQAKEGTDKHWDSEVRGLVLFVGKRSKTWYYQKDVGGQTSCPDRSVPDDHGRSCTADRSRLRTGLGQGGWQEDPAWSTAPRNRDGELSRQTEAQVGVEPSRFTTAV